MAPRKPPPVAPRLPPAAAPATPREPPPEVADAWIHGAARGVPQVSPGHPADTPPGGYLEDLPLRGQTHARHPAGVSEVSGGHPKPRAPAGSAVLFERKRGQPKRRMNVYFQTSTFDALQEYCARRGEDLSVVIDRAVAELLKRAR